LFGREVSVYAVQTSVDTLMLFTLGWFALKTVTRQFAA
jgi:hypothetical protein